MQRGLLLAIVSSLGCAGPAAAPAATSDPLAVELDRLAGGFTPVQAATFREVLERSLAEDAYVCRPSAQAVFFGAAPEGERLVAGVMPHYGFFDGPMRYLVRRRAALWEVEVTVAVDLPAEGGTMELPDCALARRLAGSRDPREVGAVCAGTPYVDAQSLEPCPASGTFSLPITRPAMQALLDLWSEEAARYWDRDAAAFGLPVRYRFRFVDADRMEAGRADLRVPLVTTCGRTPYFASFRSGWSAPIVAHELGHVLGLLDEYETFSGITRLYPKTPFAGAEISRMGLSMREKTLLLPLHHYLVLRRYFCPEPRGAAFDRVL